MGPWITYIPRIGGQQTCGELEYKRSNGQPGVGLFRWIMTLSLTLPYTSKPGGINIGYKDIRGSLFLRHQVRGDLLVGRFFQSDRKNLLEPSEYNLKRDIQLESDLDGRRINAIETLREGKNIQLILKLDLLAFDVSTQDTYPAEAEVTFRLNQSDWCEVLEQMQYRKTLLLELDAPDEANNPELSDAVKHFSDAYDQLSRGHYRAAVAQCRDVLGIIAPLLGERSDITDEMKSWLKRDDSLTKEQRLSGVNSLLIKLTHLAHHPNDTPKQMEWSSEDARAILYMTASMLQMAPKGNCP